MAAFLCAAHSRVSSVLQTQWLPFRHPMSCPPLPSDSAEPPPVLDLQPLVAFLVDYVEENGGDGAAELCKKSEMEPCHPRPVLASQKSQKFSTR